MGQEKIIWQELADLNSRFEAATEEIKAKIKILDAKVQAQRGESATAWKPEDLIGKLVWAWDDDGKTKKIGVFRDIDQSNSLRPYHVYGLASEHFCHIEPLTESEALALVYRRPGTTICPNCHREAFATLKDEKNKPAYAVCSVCGAPWNPPITEKPKTRYDWSKAPDGATHGVMNNGGFPSWLIGGKKGDPEPTKTGGWHCGLSGGYWEDMSKSCILDASGYWRDSLEKRPV